MLRIVDISGKTVLQKENNGLNSLDVSFLNSGMYFVELSDGYNIIRKKFILK
jgi:hypothetical protein